MLLTITCKDDNASEISYLFCKSPNKLQEFKISFGKAYIFYSKYTKEEVTFNLLLDIDPIDLVKGKDGSNKNNYFDLFDYINDRSYTTNSLMCTAISETMNSALNGKCKDKPELIDKEWDLTCKLVNIPVNSNNDNIIEEIFNPLGYDINYTNINNSETSNKYIDLIIHHSNIKLKDLLSHIYVLIPIFDNYKHYYIDDFEIDKLIKYGKDWVFNHPKKYLIISRYLKRDRTLIDKYFKRVKEEYNINDDIKEDDIDNIEKIKPKSLNTLRLERVKDIILENNMHTILDMGCGEGNLIKILLKEPSINKVTGIDISANSLYKIKEHIYLYKMKEEEKNKLDLLVGSCLYKDDRFIGYDCICCIEMIEHLDKYKLKDFEKVIFKYTKPKLIIITTPNKEYNILYDNLNTKDGLRFKEHKFEFTRDEFKDWCNNIIKEYDYYTVNIEEIEKDKNEELGSPTQLAIFKLK